MLLQTTVDRELDEWVKVEAKRKGLSVAAWLRMHLTELKKKTEEKRNAKR